MAKDTFQEKQNHEFELARSLSSGDPLRGIAEGVVPITTDKGEIVFHCQVSFGDYTVLVPEDKFKPGLEQKDRALVRRTLESRIGTPVYFVATAMDAASKSAFGDSVAANIKRRKLWFKKEEDGEYTMCKGKEVTGDIVAVQRVAIIVNVAGLETFIPAKNATYVRVSHMGQIFNPGSSIKLKIVEVFNRDDEDNIKFVADHKVYEQDPADKYYNKYVEGATYHGIVTNMILKHDKLNPDKVKGYKLYVQTKDNVNVECIPDFGIVPSVGDTILFRLNKKDKNENGKVFMFGSAIRGFR